MPTGTTPTGSTTQSSAIRINTIEPNVNLTEEVKKSFYKFDKWVKAKYNIEMNINGVLYFDKQVKATQSTARTFEYVFQKWLATTTSTGGKFIRDLVNVSKNIKGFKITLEVILPQFESALFRVPMGNEPALDIARSIVRLAANETNPEVVKLYKKYVRVAKPTIKTLVPKKAATGNKVGGAKGKFKPNAAITVTEEAGIALDATGPQALKQGEKTAAKATGKTAGRTVAKTIVKRGLAILGPITTAWGIYDILSGKDFPVHSGGIYKGEVELSAIQYSEKEHDDALDLYRRINSKGSLKEFKSYPTFFVYIKFAKDERIQNMPPRKVKAMINLTIDCINKKYFTASKFTVDDIIKAFNDLEKMNGLFRK